MPGARAGVRLVRRVLAAPVYVPREHGLMAVATAPRAATLKGPRTLRRRPGLSNVAATPAARAREAFAVARFRRSAGSSRSQVMLSLSGAPHRLAVAEPRVFTPCVEVPRRWRTPRHPRHATAPTTRRSSRPSRPRPSRAWRLRRASWRAEGLPWPRRRGRRCATPAARGGLLAEPQAGRRVEPRRARGAAFRAARRYEPAPSLQRASAGDNEGAQGRVFARDDHSPRPVPRPLVDFLTKWRKLASACCRTRDNRSTERTAVARPADVPPNGTTSPGHQQIHASPGARPAATAGRMVREPALVEGARRLFQLLGDSSSSRTCAPLGATTRPRQFAGLKFHAEKKRSRTCSRTARPSAPPRVDAREASR